MSINKNLISCRDCGRTMSKNAATCPGCGAPRKKEVGCLGALLVLVGFGVLMIFMASTCGGSSNGSSTRKSNSTLRQQTKKEKLDEYHRRGEFTGYTDPYKLERDMKTLEKNGSTKAGRVAQELRNCR